MLLILVIILGILLYFNFGVVKSSSAKISSMVENFCKSCQGNYTRINESGNEDNLETDYSYAEQKGIITAGTVYANPNDLAGLGWIN